MSDNECIKLDFSWSNLRPLFPLISIYYYIYPTAYAYLILLPIMFIHKKYLCALNILDSDHFFISAMPIVAATIVILGFLSSLYHRQSIKKSVRLHPHFILHKNHLCMFCGNESLAISYEKLAIIKGSINYDPYFIYPAKQKPVLLLDLSCVDEELMHLIKNMCQPVKNAFNNFMKYPFFLLSIDSSSYDKIINHFVSLPESTVCTCPAPVPPHENTARNNETDQN
jgi:hypothetical protein